MGERFNRPSAVAAGLEEHFKRHPSSAKYMNVRLTPDNHLVRQDLNLLQS